MILSVPSCLILVKLSVCLSVRLSVSQSVCQSDCLSVSQSVCQSVSQSACLPPYNTSESNNCNPECTSWLGQTASDLHPMPLVVLFDLIRLLLTISDCGISHHSSCCSSLCCSLPLFLFCFPDLAPPPHTLQTDRQGHDCHHTDDL